MFTPINSLGTWNGLLICSHSELCNPYLNSEPAAELEIHSSKLDGLNCDIEPTRLRPAKRKSEGKLQLGDILPLGPQAQV